MIGKPMLSDSEAICNASILQAIRKRHGAEKATNPQYVACTRKKNPALTAVNAKEINTTAAATIRVRRRITDSAERARIAKHIPLTTLTH